ncbi:hypothetical protein [Leptospira interrogans]|uniref:Uncharacterized protein n=1 Tax=Leptospira interrogans str. UI 12758 TaxID=1049938 RepID=A0A0E2D9J9_LEPIR|nr:hypothetical protein [Leptospira interrogans]EKR56546.1 hypothetical protein LEP1GSC105_4265 [Leptospira interrogans str. UI 12758]MCR8639006.1 hypothetical protein [Leptospira interrogans serovar Ricardi]
MLKDAIARLKKRVTISNVLKSGDTEPDLQSLASKVTTLLDAGSITADTDKIKEWAIAQGVSEESATNFASDVVDAYFDDTADEIQKSENGSEENEKKKEEEKANLLNIQNTLEILKSNQETLAVAIEHLLDYSEETLKFKEEFQKLKSELGNLSKNSFSEKTPVLSNVAKSSLNSSIEGQISMQNREEIGRLLIKGIELGQCQLEDVSYFQSTWKLSERASKFVNEYKEIRK